MSTLAVLTLPIIGLLTVVLIFVVLFVWIKLQKSTKIDRLAECLEGKRKSAETTVEELKVAAKQAKQKVKDHEVLRERTYNEDQQIQKAIDDIKGGG